MHLIELPSEILPEKWNDIIMQFQDYNFYQSYLWGRFKAEQGWLVKRFICEDKTGNLLMAAQCCIKRFPLFHKGIVWIPGGPLLKNIELNFNLARALLLSIRKILIKNYAYIVRIRPYLEAKSEMAAAIRDAGFKPISNHLTYSCDLNPPLEYIRANLSSNWRHNLRRAEKRKHLIEIGEDAELCRKLYCLIRETHAIKGFNLNINLADLIQLCSLGTKNNYVKIIMVQSSNSIPLSGRMIAIIGTKCLDLFAGTSRIGRHEYASYLAYWECIKYAKCNSIHAFDLGNIDPIDNPSVMNFKKGLNGQLIEYVGESQFVKNCLFEQLSKLGAKITQFIGG